MPTSQLPTITLTDVVVVADEQEMLDLTPAQVQPGDVAVRSDDAGSFILTDTDPSVLGNWTLLNTPANNVTSVNGQQGTITLGKADVGLGSADNTSDANKPISTATQTALNGKADLIGGVVPASQLPALALTSTVVVASQSAMLALTTGQVQPGDIAVRTDGAGTFILTDTNPATLANWTLLNAPGDAVSSVNGQTGTVSLAKSDIGLGNVDNTSDSTKNSATRTLTNKTISGLSNTLTNINADSLLDGTTNKIFTATEKTKLSGIATGATVGSTWAQLTDVPDLMGRQTANKLITVGSGGDFSTLNAAFAEASKYGREYLSKGLTVEVRQLTGFVMDEQVFVVSQDMSFITLTSVDAEVTIRRAALISGNGNSANNWRTHTYPAFCAMRGSRLPFIKTLYTIDNTGSTRVVDGQTKPAGWGTVGIYIFENSSGIIARGCGVKRAGWRGLYVDASFAYARGTIWDDVQGLGGPDEGVTGGRGIRASNMAVVMARESSAKNALNGASGAYISKAYCDLVDADCSGANDIGIAATAGAEVHANGAVVSGSKVGFRVEDGGVLHVGVSSTRKDDMGTPDNSNDDEPLYTEAINCAEWALLALEGATVTGVGAEDEGVPTTKFHSIGREAIWVRGSMVTLKWCDIRTSNATKEAVRISEGAWVNLQGPTLVGGTTLGLEITSTDSPTSGVAGCVGADRTSPARSNILSSPPNQFFTGTVSTAASTAAKTVTLNSPWTSLTPAAGNFFLITFTNGNTINTPTLAINGGDALSFNGLNGANTYRSGTAIEVGGVALVYYTGTKYSLINIAPSLLPPSDVTSSSSTNGGLISGTRLEDLMVNEATKSRTLTNKTLTSPVLSASGVPANSSSTGAVGQVAWDSAYIYVCTATNTWKRSAIGTW